MTTNDRFYDAALKLAQSDWFEKHGQTLEQSGYTLAESGVRSGTQYYFRFTHPTQKPIQFNCQF
jgi:hypothetical protein